MGRALFTAKAEPPKVEPAINWSEIESRLQEISAPARPSDLPAAAFLPLEPSATLAHDPVFSVEPPVTKKQLVSNPGDPLAEMLSLLAAGAAARSRRQETSKLLMGIEASASTSSPLATFNRVRADTN